MSGLDIVIAVVVLIGLWRGFQVGLIKTAVGLVGWFIALIAATRLAGSVSPQLSGIVQNPVLQMAMAFLLVVIAILAVMHLVAFVFSGVLKTLRLGLVDKMAGGVLGAAKNVLMVLVILSVSAPLLVQLPQWQTSVLAPELLPYAPMGKELVSDVLGVAWNQVNQS
ncbi:MAG: CvpA family protein [Psychrobacter sp.]|jgi:membrane protein required for colicin V production|uniref:CvpA family protein n=1 Tax=Psychrobacter namhaensis TaxID=292734 RepID=A0ABW8L8R4_9GAMM|nr:MULTISPECIES: CvpA family protein [Psychrobacter]MCD6252670.1 CvpA family protein [Psychrobacter sp.]HCN17317.1 colicin V production protein [Psychrobacter sp.]|tara:strand:+ start:7923 stop:8420 length:498 start_codon:yes stop_codon:yes gene_type:complete